jgi:hypothetical protein
MPDICARWACFEQRIYLPGTLLLQIPRLLESLAPLLQLNWRRTKVSCSIKPDIFLAGGGARMKIVLKDEVSYSSFQPSVFSN